jgi:hypothetical protein
MSSEYTWRLLGKESVPFAKTVGVNTTGQNQELQSQRNPQNTETNPFLWNNAQANTRLGVNNPVENGFYAGIVHNKPNIVAKKLNLLA